MRRISASAPIDDNVAFVWLLMYLGTVLRKTVDRSMDAHQRIRYTHLEETDKQQRKSTKKGRGEMSLTLIGSLSFFLFEMTDFQFFDLFF